MKRNLRTFKQYHEQWLLMASTTHQHWWQGQIESGQSVVAYLRPKYRRYRQRYQKTT